MTRSYINQMLSVLALIDEKVGLECKKVETFDLVLE